MKRPDSVIFKKYLMSLSPDDLAKYLTEYENAHKVQVKERIHKLKQEETQAQLNVYFSVLFSSTSTGINVMSGSKKPTS